MSMITENTVVIKQSALQRVLHDLYEYGCSNVKKVWSNDTKIVIIFDNNGDSPWDILTDYEAKKGDILAIETNYGDGDGYWTRVWTEYGESMYDGDLLDYSQCIWYIMNKDVRKVWYTYVTTGFFVHGK